MVKLGDAAETAIRKAKLAVGTKTFNPDLKRTREEKKASAEDKARANTSRTHHYFEQAPTFRCDFVLDITHSIFINGTSYLLKDFILLMVTTVPEKEKKKYFESVAGGMDLLKGKVPANLVERLKLMMTAHLVKLNVIGDPDQKRKSDKKSRRMLGNDGSDFLHHLEDFIECFNLSEYFKSDNITFRALFAALKLAGLLLSRIAFYVDVKNYDDLEDAKRNEGFTKLDEHCRNYLLAKHLFLRQMKIRPTDIYISELGYVAKRWCESSGGLGLASISSEFVERAQTTARQTYINRSDKSANDANQMLRALTLPILAPTAWYSRAHASYTSHSEEPEMRRTTTPPAAKADQLMAEHSDGFFLQAVFNMVKEKKVSSQLQSLLDPQEVTKKNKKSKKDLNMGYTQLD
jgi:hypothetical protein